MSKYDPLAAFLTASGKSEIRLSFADIEKIIGAALPPTAYKHRPYWSNNPSNSVLTRVWLEAGFKTERVDMKAQTVVFRKAGARSVGGAFADIESRVPRSLGEEFDRIEKGAAGLRDMGRGFDRELDLFSQIFGALKGAVRVTPGHDLTAPVQEEWEAAR
ncbi:MAG: hypothetical protein AB7P23_08995 [Amphiplicatus sp.]